MAEFHTKEFVKTGTVRRKPAKLELTVGPQDHPRDEQNPAKSGDPAGDFAQTGRRLPNRKG